MNEESKLTNEQWFCNLSTKEKAKWITGVARDGYNSDFKTLNIFNAEFWENWLQQGHKE